MIDVFSIADFHLMVLLLMVPGICRSHFTCSGNSGTAGATANITVCWKEKRKERGLGKGLQSIMGNGLSSGSLEFRFDILTLWKVLTDVHKLARLIQNPTSQLDLARHKYL